MEWENLRVIFLLTLLGFHFECPLEILRILTPPAFPSQPLLDLFPF
uniref:Uncharacterized protein n=1 Tax=Ciona intestinalis TaxID=7719 RepID=H2XTH4_CIOIN